MMRSATAEPWAAARSRGGSGNALINLATPTFEVIMRIRAGLLTPSGDLRREIDGILTQMEQQGAARGTRSEALKAVKFALAAFIDETVLTADFPLRDAWEKYPLQLEYFGEHLAGVTFFNRLDEMLKNSDGDIDLVETYYLCLLLGYEGRYNRKYFAEQLQATIEKVADHLRRANRLHLVALSPHWKVTDQPALSATSWLPAWARLAGALSLGALVLLYGILKLFLGTELKTAISQLLR
jgi:type VI secretion system protein ImpK